MKSAIVLLNMGGISNLDEVEIFLKNMFNDKYILQTNFLLRKFLANIIVKKRLNEAKENLKQIGGKSPLLEVSQSLAKKVQEATKLDTYCIMRYTPPFAKDIVPLLKEKGYEQIIAFSMYPHYSSTTTLSSIEDFNNACKKINYHPKICFIDRYFDDKEYIAIQKELIKKALEKKNPKEFSFIVSAHSLPLSIIQKGDPYQKEIETNYSLLLEALEKEGISFKEKILAYQSKVGNGKWLEPNLIDILHTPNNLKALIFPISFTIDNSETIFELAIEHKEIAQKMGYKEFIVTKVPNDSKNFIQFIAQKIEKEKRSVTKLNKNYTISKKLKF